MTTEKATEKSLIELANGLYQHSIKFFPTVKHEGKNWHPYPGEEIKRSLAEYHQKTFKLAGFKTRIVPVERKGREGWFMLLLRKN